MWEKIKIFIVCRLIEEIILKWITYRHRSKKQMFIPTNKRVTKYLTFRIIIWIVMCASKSGTCNTWIMSQHQKVHSYHQLIRLQFLLLQSANSNQGLIIIMTINTLDAAFLNSSSQVQVYPKTTFPINLSM